MRIRLVWRVAIFMMAVWCVYAIFSPLLLKIVVFIFNVINWIWYFVYRILNNIVHILHSRFGKAFANFDQAITNFCGSVYAIFDKIKTIVENTGRKKIAGKDAYTRKRPFLGVSFIILVILAVWIVLPTWLHIEQGGVIFITPYQKYVYFENKLLAMVFQRSSG